MKAKILLVDDHRLFNDGIKRLLSENFDIVAQVFDGKEVIHNITLHNPDIVMLDINLPHRKGLEIGREIKQLYPKIKVVFLSMYNESGFVNVAKEMNADGYLLKDSESHTLINALSQINAGGVFFDPSLTLAKHNLHHDDYFAKTYSLSKREVEIIKLMKEGKTTESIAQQLFVSFETIKSHRKNIYLKLGIASLAELILFAVEEGI